jgi:(p)ppGpp synthase/HD superfamily hydrolase
MIKFKQLREQLDEAVKLKQTRDFVKIAHQGQEREPGVPYHTHPLAVARRTRQMFGRNANKDTLSVAALHDVPEDTPYKADHLRKMGYPEDVVQAVELLTKDKKLSYGQNIKRIIRSGNRHAMMVKAADNADNEASTPPPNWSDAKIKKSKEKYRRSKNVLVTHLSRLLAKR